MSNCELIEMRFGLFSVGFVHKHFEVENKINQNSQFLFLLSLLPKVRSTLKLKISIFERPALIDRSNGQFLGQKAEKLDLYRVRVRSPKNVMPVSVDL